MASPDFSCAICLDTASDPVVTRCGHLFCWACLDHWLSRPDGVLECPVCKGRTDPTQAGDVIPLYGKGKRTAADTRPPAPTEAATTCTPEATYPHTNSRATPAAATEATTTEEMHHHARPQAPRAPTPPRRRRNPLRGGNPFGLGEQTGFGNTRWQFSSIGFPIMFFGVDSFMTPIMILVGLLYCAYRFLPWREWKRTLETRWQQRGQPAPAAADPNAAPPQQAPEPHDGQGVHAAMQAPPSASVVAQIQWEYFGVFMLLLGLVLLVVY